MAYGAEAPPLGMLGIKPEEVGTRVEMNRDLCVVDGETFLVRGHIEIPVHESAETFSWSVWCSLSKASFEHMMSTWRAAERRDDPPYFGWLCTRLPTYPDTLHLRTGVQNREPGRVPLVLVEASDHPLSIEQRTGITRRRLAEIAHVVLGHAD